MLTACFILVFILLSVFYLWIRQRFSILQKYGYLHEKPNFPFGNVHNRLHVVDIIKKLYEKFKEKSPAFGFYYSINPSVIITDLNVVEDILVNNFDNFNNRGIFHNKEADPLSAHLLSVEDEEWRYLRHKLIPFFTSQKMKMIFRTILNVSDFMLSSLKMEKNLEMIDAKDIFSKYVMDVIGNVIYGIDMNAVNNPNKKFRSMGLKMFEFRAHVIIKSIILTCFKKLSKILRLRLIPEDISDFFIGIVRTTLKYRKENGIKRKDILDTLISMENKGRKLSVDEIAAHCFSFYLTGFETTATACSFALYSLAMNLEIQNKLREEIKTVLERHEDKITYEAMQEMNYLQMVIDETLRLYPSIFQVVRAPFNDYKIANSDLIIPAKFFTIINIFCIHHDPEYYPEPEIFDPERFSEENKAKRHPMAYIPFGTGSRNCIGFRLGLMMTKIALIQILINYEILPNEKTPKSIKFDSRVPLLSSKDRLWMKFKALDF